MTDCVLCWSAVVAEPTVAEAPTGFGVAGQPWRAALVLYDDASDSRWSQLLATAIRGPATGTQLSELPATPTNWGQWRSRHPDTVRSLPVVVATGPGGSMAGFDCRVDGRTLAFAPGGERNFAAGGSRWVRATGEAVDGPIGGRKWPGERPPADVLARMLERPPRHDGGHGKLNAGWSCRYPAEPLQWSRAAATRSMADGRTALPLLDGKRTAARRCRCRSKYERPHGAAAIERE